MQTQKDVAKVVTRSIIGGQALSSLFFGRPHTVLEYSTVNELVNDAVAVPYQPKVTSAGRQEADPYDAEKDTKNLRLEYLCIGIKGHRSVTDSNRIDLTMPVEHKATDTGLYQIVPFVVKPLDNDLSTEQRKRFRLRKVIEIDDTLYAAYFLRKLDNTDSQTTMTLNSVDRGVTTTNAWKPTIENLRPTQPQIGYQNDGTYGLVASNVEVVFEKQDIDWFMDACELLFGHRYYSITELGYCTGVDKDIKREYPATGVQTPSTQISSRGLKEAQAVQIAYFVNSDLNPSVFNKRVTYLVDIGITEPLFTSNNIN